MTEDLVKKQGTTGVPEDLYGRLMPPDLSGQDKQIEHLLHRIVFLDIRSLHMLGRSAPRAEVRGLLSSAIGFLGEKQIEAGRELIQSAFAVYAQHVQAKNRLTYVMGVALGSCSILAIASLPRILGIYVRVAGAELFSNLLLVIAFAGLGAITSVLTRLSHLCPIAPKLTTHDQRS